jgi:hypothetical protein
MRPAALANLVGSGGIEAVSGTTSATLSALVSALRDI